MGNRTRTRPHGTHIFVPTSTHTSTNAISLSLSFYTCARRRLSPTSLCLLTIVRFDFFFVVTGARATRTQIDQAGPSAKDVSQGTQAKRDLSCEWSAVLSCCVCVCVCWWWLKLSRILVNTCLYLLMTALYFLYRCLSACLSVCLSVYVCVCVVVSKCTKYSPVYVA